MAQSKHLRVNWVDGMKISKQHFVETDNHHAEELRQTQFATLTPLNYGLLLPQNNIESLEIQVLGDAGQQIRIKVDGCKAITPDGRLIEVDSFTDLFLDTSLAQIASHHHLALEQNLVFYIVLNVNAIDRKAVGNPIEKEIPVRHPYTLPAYEIVVVPATNINVAQWGGAGIPIGKIEYNNRDLKVIHEYIPPCRTVKSHRVLREWYNRLSGFLNDIETYSFKIIQKIKTKSQKSTLSDSVQLLTDRIVNVLAVSNVSFQRLLPFEAPVSMVVAMVQVVQAIRTSIECLTDREKEELLAYLGEWADESPGSIEKQILLVIQVPYNHIEIAETLKVVDGFFVMWTALFAKLSQLEFIGKRKGQQVFIIESPVHEPPVQPEKTKSRWSPL